MADPHRVEALFEAALELSPDEVAVYLDAECGDDVELRREVEELLAIDGEGSVGVLAAPVFAFADTMRQSDEVAPVPKLVGRFSVLEKVGEGGMGSVYAAYDEELDRKVAIKLLHAGDDPAARLRLLREAQAMARVSHPHVMPVYEVGEVAGQVFLAMEFVPGQNLTDWLREDRPWSTIVDMFVAAGEGLVAAHAAGVVHRDFKPDNVMLSTDGRPRVTDFGLARGVGERDEDIDEAEPSSSPLEVPLTRTGAIMGTPRFMSPEQLLGSEVDPRSDQFSFCVALYHALFDEWPFPGDDLHELRKNMLAGTLRPVPERDDVPAGLAPILHRGLAPDPADRFPRFEELVEALARTSEGRDRDLSLGRRTRLLLAAAMTVALAASVVLFPETRSGFRTPAEAFPPAVMAFVCSVIASFALHRRLRSSPVNRQMIWLLVVSSAVMMIHRGVATLAGAAIVPTLVADQLLLGTVMVLGGVFVQRGLWTSALVSALGVLGTLSWPSWATVMMGAALLGSLVVVLVLWSRAPDRRLPTGLSGLSDGMRMNPRGDETI